MRFNRVAITGNIRAGRSRKCPPPPRQPPPSAVRWRKRVCTEGAKRIAGETHALATRKDPINDESIDPFNFSSARSTEYNNIPSIRSLFSFSTRPHIRTKMKRTRKTLIFCSPHRAVRRAETHRKHERNDRDPLSRRVKRAWRLLGDELEGWKKLERETRGWQAGNMYPFRRLVNSLPFGTERTCLRAGVDRPGAAMLNDRNLGETVAHDDRG